MAPEPSSVHVVLGVPTEKEDIMEDQRYQEYFSSGGSLVSEDYASVHEIMQ